MTTTPTAAILGAAIIRVTGTLLGVYLTNWFSARKEQQQWSRQQEAEQQKWLREQLQEIYSNCIHSLSRCVEAQHSIPPEAKKQEHLYSEAQKWLYHLLLHHPREDTKDFERFCQEVYLFYVLDIQRATRLRAYIIMLAIQDLRIHRVTSTQNKDKSQIKPQDIEMSHENS